SLMYTGTLMTENVFYPVFACVALALVLMLERPTFLRQLVLLGLCLLAFLTRTQAIFLIPAIATAPLVLVWLDRRRLRMLADFRALYGILLGAVIAVLVVQFARGHSRGRCRRCARGRSAVPPLDRSVGRVRHARADAALVVAGNGHRGGHDRGCRRHRRRRHLTRVPGHLPALRARVTACGLPLV